MILNLIGGLGFFLLGMTLLTDGLKAFAGDSLRRALISFTGRPHSAFISGAVVTAVVQSSSATTLTTIGFVSAGLITFPQAIGLLLGASLGTTSTGWLVSTLGLNFSISVLALPFVGLGTFVRLVGRGRWPFFGMALAGFGLIFVGIATLQSGMEHLAAVFDLSQMPWRGFWSSLLFMVLGVSMTVVMQSSSAAVAATLAALHTGSIDFEQGAALVIGAAIGTTVTAALAAIGANIPARRTAMAHILFNLAAGVLAWALLPLLFVLVERAAERGHQPGVIALAAFHTAFIAVGALIFLPFTGRFAELITRFIPDRGPALTRHLDQSVLSLPAVALEAARRSLQETSVSLFGQICGYLERAAQNGGGQPVDCQHVDRALLDLQEFLMRIPAVPGDSPGSAGLREPLLHGLDHAVRLAASAQPAPGVRQVISDRHLAPARELCLRILTVAASGLEGKQPANWPELTEKISRELADLQRNERHLLLTQTAQGSHDPKRALSLLDALRWMNTVGYHVWRISAYLAGGALRTRPEEARAFSARGEVPAR